MYDGGGGGGRNLTLERPDEEVVTKVQQRPRSPPLRLPVLPPARPPTTRPAFGLVWCAQQPPSYYPLERTAACSTKNCALSA